MRLSEVQLHELTVTGFDTESAFDEVMFSGMAATFVPLVMTSGRTGMDYVVAFVPDALTGNIACAFLVGVGDTRLDEQQYMKLTLYRKHGRVAVRPGWPG